MKQQWREHFTAGIIMHRLSISKREMIVNNFFIHMSINSPGSTNNVVAYAESSLSPFVDNLHDGKYIVANNAYLNTNMLLTPYLGQQRQDFAKDRFNFYLSQCSIQIEQAFGQLTNVWRVFKSPLRLHLRNVLRLIQAAMRLHNFLLNDGQCGFDDENNDTQASICVLSKEEILKYA
jgi:DDE superfamily endonuclease